MFNTVRHDHRYYLLYDFLIAVKWTEREFEQWSGYAIIGELLITAKAQNFDFYDDYVKFWALL